MQTTSTSKEIKDIAIHPKLELVHSGEDYFKRLLDLIRSATREIHIQTYIFGNDATGIEVAEALVEAREKGVEIYVCVDGYGSKPMSTKVLQLFKKHGIHFRHFSPFMSEETIFIGRRLHHKIVVIDARIALIGGINIASKYRGNEKELPWLDYAVQLESEVAESLEELCRNIFFRKKRSRKKRLKPDFKAKGIYATILQNDLLKRKIEISRSYIRLFRNAKSEVIMVASYFIPGRRLKLALQKAVKNGATVKIIFGGISDVPFTRQATTYLYDWLLRNNIELYEWNKSIVHGKVAVIDQQYSTIGSFNLNHLSSYGSIEMNVEINSKEFAKGFQKHLEEVISECDKITLSTIKKRTGLPSRFINWSSYQIVRLILIIVTYFPYKHYFKRFRLD